MAWAELVFGLLGGLAVFVYGMVFMSEGLQKAAGEKMRRILQILTGNPLIGVLVGAFVTTILQSSSATTVMVIGFVSARLMTLPQAIGVILGANIGTTVTAQLVAFKIGDYAYAVAALGFIPFFFGKRSIVKYIGQTVFAFGMLFIGLNIMSDATRPLAGSPVFIDAMTQLGRYPILGLLSGLIMTVVVQSSSATIAVLQNLASQEAGGAGQALIGLSTALPILYGMNIGTTITAILAAMGARLNAKRAAVAHAVFNIAGAILFMFFINGFASLVRFLSPKGDEYHVISRHIANAHTLFNILNTLLWLPFIKILQKAVMKLIPGRDEQEDMVVRYLDQHMIGNPVVAMDLVTKELAHMADRTATMFTAACEGFLQADEKKARRALELEDCVDMLQREIIRYLSTMLSETSLTERQSVRLAGLMHITGDVERIGDHCKNIAEYALVRLEDRIPFSDSALKELTDAAALLQGMFSVAMESLATRSAVTAKKVLSEEYEINELEESLRNSHIDRLNRGECNPRATLVFIEIVHNLEKIGDHCNNIAEKVLDDIEGTHTPLEHRKPDTALPEADYRADDGGTHNN